QQQQQQQQAALAVVQHQHQKRSAIADPKTGIPMAAYPLTAFSYPSPSPLPIQFQQPYLTAVPMTYMPSPDIAAAQGALVSVGSSYVTYIDKKGQLLDTLPICRDFKSRRCTRPQCKYVHLAE
ncbi:unnamed protein product, partial [Rotaria magnacalcarata]